MSLLQLSAAQSPVECCLAVAKAFERLQREARADAVDLKVVEQSDIIPHHPTKNPFNPVQRFIGFLS